MALSAKRPSADGEELAFESGPHPTIYARGLLACLRDTEALGDHAHLVIASTSRLPCDLLKISAHRWVTGIARLFHLDGTYDSIHQILPRRSMADAESGVTSGY